MHNTEENYLKKELYDLVKKDSSIFEFIQSGSLDGIWYWDIEKPENEWMSPRFWENFGYDPQTKKHLASEWQNLINPDDLKVAIYNFTEHCKDPNHPYDQIVRYKKSDGSTAWVRCRGLAIRNKDGKAIRFLGAHTDVTELKTREKELEELNRRNDALFLSIGEGIIAVDKTSKIIIVNKASEEMLGWSSKELIGKTFFEILTIVDDKGNILPHEQQPMELALTGKTTTTTTTTTTTGPSYNYVRKDKTRFPVAIKVAPVIVDNKIIGAVAVFSDITKEKEIDKAKTEFVSLASHQLKTPATSVKWFTEMLLNGEVGKLNKRQNEYVEEIYRGNSRMIDLVNTLLNISRIDLGTFAINPKPTKIKNIIDDILDELQVEINKKGIKVQKNYADNLSVETDPKLFRIIIQNLLSNAETYTPQNKHIIISTRKEEPNIVIEISDEGCGIPLSAQTKIFSKFFRADNAQNVKPDGNGLGLYMTKAILESLGGKISFKSKENTGTTFTVSLPIQNNIMRKSEKELT